MMAMHTIINDVPFGGSDYRVYCGSETEGWDQIDMQERRVKKLAISLQGFFESTYHNPLNSFLYAQRINGKGTYQPVFITLTYHHQEDWNPKDISALVDVYRKDWIRRLGRPPEHFRYVWVAEMQKRGVVHYHMVMWCPRGKSLPVPDLPVGANEVLNKKGETIIRYGGGWTGGMSEITGVRKGIIGYLAKYLSKGSKPADNEGATVYFPKGCRIFGMGGLSVADRRKIAYKKLPKYVRKQFDCGERIEKICGGYKQGTVELVSPWTFTIVKYEPMPCPYSPTGWTGGNLTCIMIYHELTYVVLEEKNDYLKDCEKYRA